MGMLSRQHSKSFASNVSSLSRTTLTPEQQAQQAARREQMKAEFEQRNAWVTEAMALEEQLVNTPTTDPERPRLQARFDELLELLA